MRWPRRRPRMPGIGWRPLLAATAVTAAGVLMPPAAAAVQATTGATPAIRCWLPGVARPALCGRIARPLDPARPAGPSIDIHYAVLPAQARHPDTDPVLFFAGGPGQSAIESAPIFIARHSRLNQRRDLVFIDQRGTGRSAPLVCADDPPDAELAPLALRDDPSERLRRLRDCRQALQSLPHGDLRFYTTPLASGDVDALRTQLGAPRINAIGISYGSRAVLDYLRQFPDRVRSAVLDGVMPPDMRLADAAARDNQAALEALLAACAAQPRCAGRYPDLAARLRALMATLPRSVQLPHPVSGRIETVRLDREMLLPMLRTPLYAPALAAALPAAIDEAGHGRFAPLAALAAALSDSGMQLATGMHFSVVCSEDLGPRAPPPPPADAAAAADPRNAFGDSFRSLYAQACADWPRAAVDAAFYTLPPTTVPVWLLSGGLDPVTPPRHGQRVADALGPSARHVVAPMAGHGLLALPCVRDAVNAFVIAPEGAGDMAKAPPKLDCVDALPRPPFFLPPGAAPGEAPR